MKKLCLILAVMLIVGITGFTEVKPPQDFHHFFNCVTEFGPLIDSFDGGLLYWDNLTGTASIVEIEDDNVFKHVGGLYVGAVSAIAGSTSWDNYMFEFDVMKEAGVYFNVVFRYVDENNYYMLEGGACGGTCIKLWKRVGGSYTLLYEYSQLTVNGVWYHYMIAVDGNSLKVWVENGEAAAIAVYDESYSAGKVGIGGYDSTVYFDNVFVMGPNVKILKPNEILVSLVGSGMLGFKAGPTFQVLDNDMTDGQAWVQIPVGLYDTFDQVRGKPGGSLFWGNLHIRGKGKPVWEQHNDPLNWWSGRTGNWLFTNNGITCYSFRLYPIQ